MATGKRYTFTGCTYKVYGQEKVIPDGTWDVAELDMVGVYLDDGRIFDVPKDSFNSWKAKKKVVLVVDASPYA